MKKLLLLLTIISLYSCSPAKRLSHFAKKHPELFEDSVIKKDSVSHKETVVIRDTTIYIPGEKLIIKDYALCDSLNKSQLKKKIVKSGRITATVEIKDSKVIIECLTDSLIKELELRDKIITDYEFHSVKEKNIVKLYKVYWYDIAARWIAGILLPIFLIFIYFIFKH